MAILEGTIRLLPGVLGDGESVLRDSFNAWPGADGLDHAHWTRPPEYRGRGVPEVLRSGDHGAIEEWRRRDSRRQSSERSGAGDQTTSEQEPKAVPGEE